MFSNIDDTSFLTNFNYTYPKAICVQYQRILLNREEDFKGLVNRNQIFAFFNSQSSPKCLGEISL